MCQYTPLRRYPWIIPVQAHKDTPVAHAENRLIDTTQRDQERSRNIIRKVGVHDPVLIIWTLALRSDALALPLIGVGGWRTLV
jgi:hypothetical protein